MIDYKGRNVSKMKKIIITIITTIIITLLFIIVKNLIYGTATDFIADYMTPSSSTENEFVILAHVTTIRRLFGFIIFNILFSIFYTKILFKTNFYVARRDLIYTFIVFIVPLIICYVLIYSQLDYTC